jgi:hypothetical protein
MTISLKTNTDGWNQEGVGSICQWNILLAALAQDLNVHFCTDPFSNLNHYQYNGFSSKDWSNLFTKFFNFKSRNLNDRVIQYDGDINGLKNLITSSNESLTIDVSKQFIVNTCFSRISEFGDKGYFTNIRNNLVFEDDVYFDKDYLNISLHLRSTNPGDIPPDCPAMETFGVWLGEDKICNLIDQLKQKYYNKKVRLYVHSQGDSKKFSVVQNKSTEEFQVILKLNELPTKDLYHMSYSDVLILARSSYSWIAHLLNDNLTIARDNFHQPLKSGIIFLNSNYTF